ncbi:MAG: hypothetical protein HY078_01235 [Elusimicrobia bacterium]|nr:hypothetical protein [Elusimicrobiota bacterium]
MNSTLPLKFPKFVLALLAAAAVPAAAYYGYSSSEVELSFDNVIEIQADRVPSMPDLAPGGDAYENARQQVESQVQYLVGWFQSPSFVNSHKCATVENRSGRGPKRIQIGCAGTMGESIAYRIEFTKAEAAAEDGWVRLSYKFAGPAVFRKKMFALGGTQIRDFPLTMPLAPERSIRVDRKKCVTDTHYASEEDFFYFWDPDMAGCPLADKSRKDILRIKGMLTKKEGPRTPNPTKIRWPNYGKLYGDNFNGRDIVVSWFIGYVDEDKIDLSKVNTRDSAYSDFQELQGKLKGLGLKLNAEESVSEFRFRADGEPNASNGRRIKGINFLQVWEKTASWKGQPVRIKLRLVLTDTRHDSRDVTFHTMYRQALSESDFLIYDGHSGLGGNLALDMDRLQGVSWNPAKFQVFLFNGCSGNAYFPRQYAQAKGKDSSGKMNLRVMASSLPTLSSNAVANQIAFIKPFITLTTPDWKTLVKNMDASTPERENVLYGVNGEGDDDWTP